MPALASQFGFAAALSASAVGVRAAIDSAWSGAGPFGLTVPFVLAATLYGRWRAGVICQLILSLHAWYFVLPNTWSFSFATPTDGPRVLVNMAAGFVIVGLGEIFRRATRDAIKGREALFLELEHRVKNSFSSVSGLLRMQLRETEDDDAKSALRSALARVDSYARAYSHLSQKFDEMGALNLRKYLPDLCTMLQETVDADRNIRIDCQAIDLKIARDRAIALGLVVSEVVSNSVKHAFDDEGGTITLSIEPDGDDYLLTIGDDGKGIRSDETRKGAFGLKLIQALATQAQATIEMKTDDDGTRFFLWLRP